MTRAIGLTGILVASLTLSALAQAAAMEDAASSTQTSSSTFPAPREVLQEGLSPSVGITAGVANPEGSYKSGAEYGIGFAFQPYIPFGLGMYLTFSKNQSKYSNTRDLDRTAAMVRGTYNFGGSITLIKDSFVGIMTGPIINQDATYFGVALVVGFDIPVREWSGTYLSYLSVGAEAKYMIVSSNESDGLVVNGVLKYWF
jgi:hypothetical protein